MSHVTEGQLHAYLDGALEHETPADAEALVAHLRTCGDCRARLGAAERLRDRASQILAEGAPRPTGLPAFEEILHRAEQERPFTPEGESGKPGRGRKPGVRLGSLAWAASVLLAVGLGWAARTYWNPGGNQERVALLDARTRTEAVARAGEGDVARAATEKLRIEVKGADTDAAPEARRSLAAPPVASSVAGEEPGETLRPGADVWVATDDETAARWIGGEPLRVEGLSLLDVSISTRDGARIIRSRQLLASGQLVEVYQARARGAEGRKVLKQPAAVGSQRFRDTGRLPGGRTAADEPQERAALEGRIAGFQVELAAPVALDSLRALLSKLR